MIERLERLINLVIALRETPQPLTAAEIRADVAGYGQRDHAAFRRMFERDKADLRALGVPVETIDVPATTDVTGYRIDARSYDLPACDFTADELAALAVAVAATGLTDAAGTGLHKLAVSTDDDEAPLAVAPAVGVTLAAPHVTELLTAQVTRTPVRFSYRVPGNAEQARTVDPHALVHRAGRWYLIGHDHDRQAGRAFRLDRVRGDISAAGVAGAFTPPDHPVDVDAVVPVTAKTGPETAEVAVAESLAWLVARRARGGGHAISPPPGADGRWTAFTVPAGEHHAFLDWALQFGPDLVVLAPPSLRSALIAAVRATKATVVT